jgi:hypothetical protein
MSSSSLLFVSAAAALCLTGSPAGATRFVDLHGSDQNAITMTEDITILLSGDPGRLVVLLPRAEALISDGEIAFFQQTPSVTYDCVPFASLEDRSEWYTVLTWHPGTLAGTSQVRIMVTTQTGCSGSLPGLSHDVSRLPGAWYTSHTASVEQVPGIDEAVGFLEATQSGTPGVPTGDLGLAQRWMAYIHGVLEVGSCAAPGGIDGAAWAWTSGVADCDGFANVFASGMRTLDVPTCLMIGFLPPGGPRFGRDQHWHDSGFHAWAGVWSEGYNQFLPVDVMLGEFGFLDYQRVHIAYLEDLTYFRMILSSTNGTARFGPKTTSQTQAQSISDYSEVRTRLLLDGYDTTLLAHDAPAFRGPGEVSGVDDDGAPVEEAARLRVSSPFREALSVSLLVSDDATATIDVFDVAGRRVARLAEEASVRAGESFFRWLPRRSAAGVYMVRASINDGDRVLVRRAVRIP